MTGPAKNPMLAAFAMAVNAFLILTGYECVRSPATILFQKSFSVESIPVATTVTPLVMLAMVYVYNLLLTACGSLKTFITISLFSAVALAASAYAYASGFGFASAIVFVFKEAYIVLLIEQSWAFINSVLTQGQGKKINGILSGIMTTGGMLGGYFVGQSAVSLGTVNLIYIAAFLLIPAALIQYTAFHFGGEPRPTQLEDATGASSPQSYGFRELFSSPVLILLFCLVTVSQAVSTVNGLSMQTMLHEAFPNTDEQTAFSGNIYFWLSIASVSLQVLFVPFLQPRIPPAYIQMFIPVALLVMNSYSALNPTLYSAVASFMMFKAFDYSIFRTSKEIFYMPLSFDSRYRAKKLIDVLGYRFSKGLTSAGIVAAQAVVASAVLMYRQVSILSICIWIGIAAILIRKTKASTR